jgi:hypothetical protein
MTHRGDSSKRERTSRPRKPEFATAGVVIGCSVGLLAGFGVEVILKQKMIVMMLGGIAGVLLGTGIEAIGSGGGCIASAQPETPKIEYLL